MIITWYYERQGNYFEERGVCNIVGCSKKKSSNNMGKEMSLLDLAIRRTLLSETVEVKV